MAVLKEIFGIDDDLHLSSSFRGRERVHFSIPTKSVKTIRSKYKGSWSEPVSSIESQELLTFWMFVAYIYEKYYLNRIAANSFSEMNERKEYPETNLRFLALKLYLYIGAGLILLIVLLM